MGKKKRKKHPKKNTEAKDKKPAECDDLAKGVLRAAISHALSSGWVQNSTIAFLGAFVLWIVAMATNSQIKTATLACALMGTAALWIAAAAVIKYAETENPPFAVKGEFIWQGMTRDSTQIFAEYNVQLTPVPIAMYVRLVNLQSVPSRISLFKVEVEKKEGWWIFPSRWLRTVRIPETMPLIWRNPDHKTAKELIPNGDRLESIIQTRPLEPHETVHGWVFLDAAIEFDSAIKPPIYRFSIKDTAGQKLAVIQSTKIPSDENTGPPRSFTFENLLDISGIPVRHLADPAN